ncbi:MAG: hypothetical protein IJ646_10660, partial [Clostridia bacterium]|nr:hypothetical protein [Clostridia bacterium]
QRTNRIAYLICKRQATILDEYYAGICEGIMKRANALNAEQARVARGTARRLNDMAAKLTGDMPPFEKLKELFAADGAALNAEAAEARAKLNNMFAFCEQAFPEGQELLILVTELTASPAAARFIARYGCDAYFRHSTDLMFHERRNDLRREIEKIRLD